MDLDKKIKRFGWFGLAIFVFFLMWIENIFIDKNEKLLFQRKDAEEKNNIVNGDKTKLNENYEEILFDYGAYYALFVLTDKYCQNNGYKLRNLEIIRKRHQKQINVLVKKASSYRTKRGHSVVELLSTNKYLKKEAEQKIKREIAYSRKLLIIEKIADRDKYYAAKALKDLSNDEILKRYGSVVSEKETCSFLDEMMLRDNDFQNMDFLNKYSSNR